MVEDAKYPVAETFLSIQGEGIHAGRRAFFIRLAGCPVRCPWCDTKDSWNAEGFEKISASGIAERVGNAEMAVITGGEPCSRNLESLVKSLKSKGVAVHLETSGVFPVVSVDWVSLSPKLFRPPIRSALEIADELKCVVSRPEEILEYSEFAKFAKNAKAVWLNPEWSKSDDRRLLSAITDFVMSNGGVFRAGWQMHKNYFAR